MKQDLIIAVDVGTGSLKVGLIGPGLDVLHSADHAYPVSYPGPGCAEQDPLDWWLALRLALVKLSSSCPGLRERAAGMVIASQMCGVVAVDREGQPLRPCLIWLDKRAAAIAREVMGGFPKVIGYGLFKLLNSIRLTNGAPSLNGMDPPAKMLWLKRHEPQVYAKAWKLLDVKDWLLLRATGHAVTTADLANVTWMMDTRKGREGWSDALIGRFGLTRELLPEIIGGTASPGGLTAAAATELGLAEGLPVFAGAGDVCAAAIGSGAVEDGELHISLGTSSWISGFYPGRRLSASEGYATILSPFGNRPLLIATQESAGSCLDWLARVMGPELEEETPGVAPPLFLPWLAGERVPVDDNRLRGAFLGLSLQHGRDSLRQAVTEGVALNTRWAWQSVARQKGTRHAHLLRAVGGGALNATLCQALADCLGADIAVARDPRNAGVRGAAAIAAAGLGWRASVWEAAKSFDRSSETVYRPDPSRRAYFDRRFALFLDAYKNNARWFRSAFQDAGR
ncbi:MAG: FGGY-family carbohydrate kinase [Aestuariivirga sp.]|uniref:xylulokinase n=1 Tax=Aestuariivirga sp. TaxID=2650926 RepID=UPI0025B7CA44|nr:FGGY-family carbohydrate kinase [Aestuariivirga sp.]MCA3561686.1 FGGY-family carbohydrate kinase [Aestuariivirga sp.]